MKKLVYIMIVVMSLSLLSGFAFAEEEIIELYVGESIPLDTKVVSGEIIKDQSGIVWTYSEEGICSISSSDTISGKKAGKVTVTGNLNQGSTILEVKFDVLVKNTVKSIGTTIADQNLRVGESFTATYTLVPVELLAVAMNKGVKFTTTDKDVLTVSSSGVVKLVGVGEAYVIIESTEAGKKDHIKVTVRPTVSNVSIDQKSEKIYVGETRPLTVTYTPITGETIFLKESIWESFDKSVVTVTSDGVVKGIKAGTAAVRATSKDNSKISTVSVAVVTGVKDITLSDKVVNLSSSYKTHELIPTIIPVTGLSEAFEKGVTWKSSDTNVVSISSSGLLTAKRTGSATITATAKDGGEKAYCSVKVSLPSTVTTDPKVKITDIQFNMDNVRVNVGEKTLLDFTVTPENADRSSLKFTVRSSGFGEVIKEGDFYYYRALKEGAIFLDAYNGSNKYDETVFFAKSMLNGFTISESNMEKEYGMNVIYLGQKLTLEPNFDMAIGDYPLLDEVKYTSSDTKIAKIVDGDTVEALTLGSFVVKGVTADNGLEHSINMKVVSNIKALEAEKSARIGIGMAYQPSVNFVSIDNPLYDINEVLANSYTLTIDKIKISSEFVEAEIEYSKNRKAELNALVDSRSGDLNENLAELQKCHQRLFDYELIYKYKSGNYCDISSLGHDLTDRNYNKLEVAKISKNTLYAYIVSEIDLKVESLDPKVFTEITASVEDNVSSIVIFDENGEVITASVDHILTHYTDAVLFQNNPSSWAVDIIKLANSKGLLVPSVIDEYNAYITREEFMEIVMNYYDVVLGFPEVDYASYSFTDTNNISVLKAHSLGIISGRGPGIFAPHDNVTREEMCVILDKTIKVMNRELEIKRTYKAFSDIGSVSTWAKEAVDIMTNTYDILSGVGGNVFSPKGNTTKEQAIIVIYKVFNGLK